MTHMYVCVCVYIYSFMNNAQQFIGPGRKGGKVRTILWTHTFLGHQEIDFINGMGEVGGPTSYYFIGPKISNGGHDGSLKLNKNVCVLHKETETAINCLLLITNSQQFQKVLHRFSGNACYVQGQVLGGME